MSVIVSSPHGRLAVVQRLNLFLTLTEMQKTFTYWSRGKQHKRTETNGHYRFSLAGVTIINDYPWVETTVRGDGGHWLNGRGY